MKTLCKILLLLGLFLPGCATAKPVVKTPVPEEVRIVLPAGTKLQALVEKDGNFILVIRPAGRTENFNIFEIVEPGYQN